MMEGATLVEGVAIGSFPVDGARVTEYLSAWIRKQRWFEAVQGIVLGGSGNGEAITANKARGIRAAVCWNVESATLARTHNNANVLSIGQRMMSEETAIAAVEAWLSATFEAGRHVARIEKVAAIEERTFISQA